jgi:hemolysin-activating ACP:hemolysin acyltransferase
VSSDEEAERIADETERWLEAYTNETHLPVEGWDAWTDTVSGEKLYFICFMTPGGRATAVLSDMGFRSFLADLEELYTVD